MFADLDQPIKRFAVDQRLKVGADVDIGARLTRGGVAGHPDLVIRPGNHPVADIGDKRQPIGGLIEIHRNKWSIFHLDADFFHRRDKEIRIPLAPNDAGEQPDQFDPANRRAQIKPCAVAGDPHVDIAAKRRVPQMHRRRAFAPGCAH